MVAYSENNLLNKGMLKLPSKLADVYCVSISAFSFYKDILKKILSKDEIQRCNRYRFDKDKNTYVVSRSILRILISYYINKTPGEIRFRYSINGKPYLCENDTPKSQRCYFNISHSGDVVIIAISNKNFVGVDVELIDKNIEFNEISTNFFSKVECNAIKLATSPINMFYNIWTQKEAYVKAMGGGLTIELNSFVVPLCCEKKSQLHLQNGAFFELLPFHNSYSAALVMLNNFNKKYNEY